MEINSQDGPNLRADLKRLQFPATKQEVIAHLTTKGLPDRAAVAGKIPDREYADVEAVRAEFLKHGSS